MNKIGIIYLKNNLAYCHEFGDNCEINEIVNTLIELELSDFDIIETPLNLETYKRLHYII